MTKWSRVHSSFAQFFYVNVKFQHKVEWACAFVVVYASSSKRLLREGCVRI